MMSIVCCNELKETYVNYSTQDDIHDLPEADMAIMRRAAALVTKYMVVDIVNELYGCAALRI